MATYTAPTPAELKLHFPAFAAVDDAVVQYNIDRANRSVDLTWTEGDYTTAIELLACHYMELAGLGTGTEAEMNAQGLGGFSMIRSGQLTLQRSAKSAGGDDAANSEWGGTLYGRQFYWLLRKNKPPVAVAGGTAPGPFPPYYPGPFFPGYWPW